MHQDVVHARGVTEALGEVLVEEIGVREAAEGIAVVVGRTEPQFGDQMGSDVDAGLDGKLQGPLGRPAPLQIGEVAMLTARSPPELTGARRGAEGGDRRSQDRPKRPSSSR